MKVIDMTHETKVSKPKMIKLVDTPSTKPLGLCSRPLTDFRHQWKCLIWPSLSEVKNPINISSPHLVKVNWNLLFGSHLSIFISTPSPNFLLLHWRETVVIIPMSHSFFCRLPPVKNHKKNHSPTQFYHQDPINSPSSTYPLPSPTVDVLCINKSYEQVRCWNPCLTWCRNTKWNFTRHLLLCLSNGKLLSP